MMSIDAHMLSKKLSNLSRDVLSKRLYRTGIDSMRLIKLWSSESAQGVPNRVHAV